MKKKLEAFEDPNHPGNSAAHHSGRKCDVKGCTDPAGTAWGPYWCFKHNVERIKRISANLKAMTQ